MTAVATHTEPPVAAETGRAARGYVLAAFFTVTSFAGAALLFTVQPMVARLLLPSYGGSATVWSTSSLFFQVVLLAGYVYSHVTTTRLGPARQPWLHLLVLAGPVLLLPVALPGSAAPGPDQSPVLWLLRTLVVMIGLPFAVLCTTGPLLQKWYSWSGGPRSEDPYFMFAASNLGSFGGLLAYPALIEPHLTLTQQRFAFSVGFVAFAVMTGACGLVATRGDAARAASSPLAHPAQRLGARRVLTWGAYAFVPSCLMLAVTAHLATDVASVPLLWVAPLATYLATFVMAFARSSRRVSPVWPRLGAAIALASAVIAGVSGSLPIGVVILASLSILGVAGFAAHSRLAADRPDAGHLTTFYLVVATGGALGGLVNGLVAPLVFDRVLEYDLSLAAIPLLLLGLTGRSGPLRRPSTQVSTVVVGILVCGALLAGPRVLSWASGVVDLGALITLAVVTLVGWVLATRPVGMVAGLLAGFLLLMLLDGQDVIARERTFYGSYEVRSDSGLHQFNHGTTVHGTQFVDEARRSVPTAYYSRSGPLGDVFDILEPRRSAVVGLGAGTIAAYGETGDEMSFFEIDEAVADIAADPRLFTYLADSPATVRVEVGDGRLLLTDEPSGSFDLVVLDAFSSDSIPIHLLTVEAMRLYASRVDDGGAIAVHVSNRVFDLAPVVEAARRDLGWHAAIGEGGSGEGASISRWIVLSPEERLTSALLDRPLWSDLDPGRVVEWTDDYSSVLSVLR